MKSFVFAVCGSLFFISAPTYASCYGTGYNRVCDGIGGPGATYSPRGNEGSTQYRNNGQTTRQQYYDTTPTFDGGTQTEKRTIYYNR